MVPRLLSRRRAWCQGFSEPGSGSDLASLTTRAVAATATTGSSTARRCGPASRSTRTRCVLLTRTGAGTPTTTAITAFFVDMDTPGITVRPLRTMHGVDEFCEVYFDDVVVPARPDARQARRRLAARDGPAALRTLDLLLAAHRLPVLAVRRADRTTSEDSAQAADSDLGAAYLALHTLRCRSRATQHRLADGARSWARTPRSTRCCWPAPNSSSTTPPAICCRAPSNSTTPPWRTEYLYSRAATIYGGTAEMQRNIIARRLLDLGKE